MIHMNRHTVAVNNPMVLEFPDKAPGKPEFILKNAAHSPSAVLPVNFKSKLHIRPFRLMVFGAAMMRYCVKALQKYVTTDFA